MDATVAFRMWRIVFTIFTVLFALGYGLLLSLLLGLLGPAWDAGGSEFIHRLHHVGATIFIALLLVGLLAQLHKPEQRIAAFQQAILTIVAIEIMALIVGDPDNHGGNVGVIDPVMLIFVVPILILAALHPARRELLRFSIHLRPGSATIAVLGAIAFGIYGVDQALVQRSSWPPAADPHHNGHWMAMAIMAFAISLIGLLAALRRHDRHIPALSAGTAAIVFGLSSLLMPDLASSIGRVWGVLSMLGGIMLIVIIMREARHASREGVYQDMTLDEGIA